MSDREATPRQQQEEESQSVGGETGQARPEEKSARATFISTAPCHHRGFNVYYSIPGAGLGGWWWSSSVVFVGTYINCLRQIRNYREVNAKRTIRGEKTIDHDASLGYVEVGTRN